VDATAELSPVVRDVALVEHMAGRQISDRARGGMITKLQAARLATGSGVDVVIANGREREVLPRLAAGESIGTLFPAAVDRLESRKRWIRAGIAPRGRIQIDEGAVHALTVERKSLLPAGITAVDGSFQPADLVEIVAPNGNRIASGVSRYGSADIQRIKGKRSDRILETLGFSYGHEVVHCDDLVLD
ncbi:MAG: glutamate 5-kinase, partial [Dehalococcoidia bacterium]